MRALIVAALAPLAAAAAPMPDYAEPYRILQQANLALDPALATSAYASDARLIFDYPGQPTETFQDHASIRASYVRTFGQVDPGSQIKLAFRFEPPGLSLSQQRGVYRIDARAAGRPITVYGRFAVKLTKDAGGWRFAEDRGSPASAAEFEKLPSAQLDRR